MKLAWKILKETFMDFVNDGALSRGAAISYYTVLSIGPVLVICIAIAALFFGQDAAQGAMVGQLRGLMGDQAAELIQTTIKSASNRSTGLLATAIGIGTLLITASGVFVEMQASLNMIWKAEPQGSVVSAWIKGRIASLGLVAAMGFLLLVSLVISAGIHAVGDYLNLYLPFAELILQVINFLISLAMVTLLFGAIYKILPDRQLVWKDVGVGALVTALMFTIGKTAIGYYIGSSSVASSYGAAGALIVILIWIYYSSQIFLLGAEFTKVWASYHGSKEAFAARAAGQAAPAVSGPRQVVETAVTHRAAGRRSWGLFELGAVAALILFGRRPARPARRSRRGSRT